METNTIRGQAVIEAVIVITLLTVFILVVARDLWRHSQSEIQDHQIFICKRGFNDCH